MCQSQIIEQELRASLKNIVFWSNPHKIETMVTCPMEMLELLDFRHMTAPTV